jgi:hypothetical protein
MKVLLNCIMAIMFALAAKPSTAGLLPGEGIVRDPRTGDYIATYMDEGEDGKDRLETAYFRTATKIDPTVRSKFRLIEGWNIRYAFTISNGNAAKQAISQFELYGLPINALLLNTTPLLGSGNAVLGEQFDSAMSSPSAKWEGSGGHNRQTLKIGWLYDCWDDVTNSHNTAVGIQPGESITGFGFASPDLPGVFVAQLFGNTRYHQFNFSGPGPDYARSDIARQMDEVVGNDFVPRNVAAPLIIVPRKFDAAIVLEGIRTHVATWPAKQLVDPAFAIQLDRYLDAAAKSFRLNQSKAGRDHIETLRKLLAKEHHHVDHEDEDDEDTEEHKQTARRSIDRLAARVLDFDLRYVLKRMEQVREDHEDHDRQEQKNR